MGVATFRNPRHFVPSAPGRLAGTDFQKMSLIENEQDKPVYFIVYEFLNSDFLILMIDRLFLLFDSQID